MAVVSEMVLSLRQNPQHRFWEQPHPCPNCGRSMQLSVSRGHSSGISGFHSYACGECGLSMMEADEAR